MKRHKVEFTIILEEGGEPQHIVREHDVLVYADCEGYNALLFAPPPHDGTPYLVWNAVGYGSLTELDGAVKRYLQRDALDLINAPVRVGEVSNG